jgi:hypothetical protein
MPSCNAASVPSCAGFAAAIWLRPPAVRPLRAVWPVAAAAVSAYGVLALVQFCLVARSPWNDTFTAKTLLWMHADLAVKEFRRDLAAPTPPPHAALLRKMIPKIEKEIVGYNVSHWRTLTFNSNALMYSPGNPDEDAVNAFPNDPEGYKRFCLKYYERIIQHQPAAYFGEVAFMLRFYYDGQQDDGAFREFTQLVTEYLPASAALARELAKGGLPTPRARLERAAMAMDQAVAPTARLVPPAELDALVRIIHVCFLPMTLAGVACGAVTLLWSRTRAQASLVAMAWLCLGSALVLFAQELTIAMVTMTEGRYADALRTLAVVSLVCALAMVGAFLVGLGRSLRTPLSPAI